jgi:hypothetical protein
LGAERERERERERAAGGNKIFTSDAVASQIELENSLPSSTRLSKILMGCCFVHGKQLHVAHIVILT